MKTVYNIRTFVIFSGDSVLRFHANTEDKDGKLVLNDLKVNLHLGNVEVRIVKSQNPTLGIYYDRLIRIVN